MVMMCVKKWPVFHNETTQDWIVQPLRQILAVHKWLIGEMDEMKESKSPQCETSILIN